MKESWAALRASTRNPAIRRLQLAYAGSATGYWAASIAVTAFSYAAGGAAAVALQVSMRMIPAAFAAPFTATLADRYSRVRIMAWADALRVVIFLGMAALLAVDATPAIVYVGSALAGIVDTAFEPARQAITPDLARDPEELTASNAVASAIDSTSFFVGPAIAGAVLIVSSPALVLVVTSATLLWSALLVRGIPEPRRAPGAEEAGQAREPFLRAARAGFATVRRHRDVRLVIALIGAQVVVAGLEGALIAALAFDVLDVGESGLGFLNTALGIGGLLGAVAAVALVGRRRLASWLGVGCILWGAPFVLIGAVPTVVLAVVALAIVGVANTLVDVTAFTLLQRVAPPEVLGRVFGIMESMLLGSFAVGAAAAPLLIAALDVEGALIAQGLFLPAVVALAWGALRRLDGVTDAGLAASGEALRLLRGVPLFAPLPAPVVERLAAVAERVRVPAGETLFRQGDAGDRFYVIAGGRAGIDIDGRRVDEQVAGDSFGEIALLRDQPRTATIQALEDLELLALERDEFVPAVTGYPSSREAADRVMARRMVRARQVAVTA